MPKAMNDSILCLSLDNWGVSRRGQCIVNSRHFGIPWALDGNPGQTSDWGRGGGGRGFVIIQFHCMCIFEF